jgi:site-specific recombinase XerD
VEYEWYLYKERQLSEESVQNIRTHLGYFYNWYRMTQITSEGPSKETLIAFREYLVSRIKPSTVNLRLKIANQFNDFLVERKLSTNKKVKLKDILLPIREGDNLQVATPIEYIKLKRAMTNEYNPRDILILALLVELGIKASEIIELEVNQIKKSVNPSSNEPKYVLVRKVKGKQKQVLLTDEFLVLLFTYLKHSGIKEGHLFLNKKGEPLYRDIVNQILDKYCELGGLNRILSPMSLRNLYIKNLFDNGLSVTEVSELTGIAKNTLYSTYRSFSNTNSVDITIDVNELPENIEDEFVDMTNDIDDYEKHTNQ